MSTTQAATMETSASSVPVVEATARPLRRRAWHPRPGRAQRVPASTWYLKFGAAASPASYTVQITSAECYMFPHPVGVGQAGGIWASAGELATRCLAAIRCSRYTRQSHTLVRYGWDMTPLSSFTCTGPVLRRSLPTGFEVDVTARRDGLSPKIREVAKEVDKDHSCSSSFVVNGHRRRARLARKGPGWRVARARVAEISRDIAPEPGIRRHRACRVLGAGAGPRWRVSGPGNRP
jgi:hypothetical protein